MIASSRCGCVLTLLLLVGAPPFAYAEGGVYVLGVPANDASSALAVRAEVAARSYLGSESPLAANNTASVLGYGDEARRALEEAQDSLEAGRRAYLDVDFPRAIALLTAAVDGFDRGLAAAEPAVARELGEALIFLGAAQAFSGQERAARTVFRRLHVQMPQVSPDPNQFPPDVIERYQQAAPRDRESPDGSIEVTSAQPGASVFVDLQAVGVAPVTVGRLLGGTHSVRVLRPGSTPFVQRVEVEKGRVTTVQATFTERAGEQGLGDAMHMLVTAAVGADSRPAQVDDVAEQLGVAVVGLLQASLDPSRARVELRLDLYAPRDDDRLFRGTREAAVAGNALELAVRDLLADGIRAIPASSVHVQTGPDRQTGGHQGQGNSRGGSPRGPKKPWQKWWFWTAIGGVVVAGVAIGAAVAVSDGTDPGALVLEFPRASAR